MGLARVTRTLDHDDTLRSPEKTDASRPFFFVQMADPRFGFFNGDRSFERETALYKKAIAHVNRLRPAFVVNCGDLVNKPGDAAQIAELFRITKKLDPKIRMHWVAGNHDVGTVPTSKTLETYRKKFAPDRYAFRHERTHCIVINSCVCQHPEKVQDEWKAQLKFLEKELERATKLGSDHKLIFLHHPLFLSHPKEKNDYFTIPKERRLVIVDLLKKQGVRAVFSGHYHRNALGRAGELEMIVTGPVGKPLGKDPSGFRIVRVYPDRIEHSYHGFEKMPRAVRLRGERR